MSTIAEQLQELAQIKEAIRQAIIAKGVTVSSDAAFSTYATAIGQISGGGGGEELAALIDRSITSITIPNGVTKIGVYVFNNCRSLESVSIPSSVTTIDQYAFARCDKIVSLTLPSNLTTIGQNAFTACSKLQSITIPSGVTLIDGNTFNGCSALEEIDIPAVTSIGQQALTGCRQLATIICRATTPPTVSSATFGNGLTTYVGGLVASGKVLYVPHGCSSAYTSATNEWKTVLLEPTKCNFTIAELNADGSKPNS